ncbi:hypothetical protein TWF730_001441 [Orbilia blumenaviensis]|uniref:PD-(D/E)XK nuclease-like domain-containing protein n=1 Tax=Orbilia blumenaviensis TaxID=1796055 RepID=A0AAV9UIL4_9PEZI
MITAARKRSRSTSSSRRVSGGSSADSLSPTVQKKRIRLETGEVDGDLTLKSTPDVLQWLSDLPTTVPNYPLNLPKFQNLQQKTLSSQPGIKQRPQIPLVTVDLKKAAKSLADFEIHRSDAGSLPSVQKTSSGKDDISSISHSKSTEASVSSDINSDETETSVGIADARLQLRHSYPPILFSHCNQAITGPLPVGVKEFLKRTSPDNLAQGCLPRCIKEELENEYLDTILPNWIFSDADSVDGDTNSLLLQVKRIVQMSTDLLILNADEQPWSELVNCILNGVVRRQLFERPIRKLHVKRMYMCTGEESYFEAAYLDSVLDIEVNFMLEANFSYPQSPLKKLREQCTSGDLPEDFNLSPLWDPVSRFCPSFAVVRSTCEAGDWQEAQMHAGMGAVAILEKGRFLGASKKILPCVPALVVIGHRWELNLIYEDDRGNYVVGGPWSIGGSNSFLEALKLVLVMEELWKYGSEEWWSAMVENIAVNAHEKYAHSQPHCQSPEDRSEE